MSLVEHRPLVIFKSRFGIVPAFRLLMRRMQTGATYSGTGHALKRSLRLTSGRKRVLRGAGRPALPLLRPREDAGDLLGPG